jgi:DNA replication protein DnaC
MDPNAVPTVDKGRIAELTRRAATQPKRSDWNASGKPTNGHTPEPLPTSGFQTSRSQQLPDRACPECGDQMSEGVILLGVPYYPHLKTCAKLAERIEREDRALSLKVQSEWRLMRANLPPVGGPDTVLGLEDYRGRFRPTGYAAGGAAMAQSFLRACGEAVPADGFTLCGAAGSGKTTLAEALTRDLLAAGVDVRWETVPNLYNAMIGALKREDFEAEFRRLSAYRVLVLDDLGREKPSPWWVDQVLFPLVTGRVRAGRPMIVTTNYGWDALQAIYDGARSERGETAHSGPQLIDRLRQRAALVPFGKASLRNPGWSFVKGGVR